MTEAVPIGCLSHGQKGMIARGTPAAVRTLFRVVVSGEKGGKGCAALLLQSLRNMQ